MRNRREFFEDVAQWLATLSIVPLVGCGKQGGSSEPVAVTRGQVILYDTHAMALYYDGTLGPKTGVVKVQYIIDGKDITLDFWHGHGGKPHRFTLTAAHYTDLKALKKVTIETTRVDGHSHKLFVDPNNPKYRVPGAPGIPVTV